MTRKGTQPMHPDRTNLSLFESMRHCCEVCGYRLTLNDRQRATGICDVCWASHDEMLAEEEAADGAI